LIRQEVPIMLGASLMLLAFTLDGKLSFLEGGSLFALLAAYTVFLVVQSRREKPRPPRTSSPRPSSLRRPAPGTVTGWYRLV
jgi:Ca2+/Na+ antiporter